jgi:hypothetical protein
MLKQIIEPLGTLTSIFHHYLFQIFSKRGDIVSTDAPSMLVYVDAHTK